VTYYLPAAAIDTTLAFVSRNWASGSTLCFDYLIDAPDILERHGVKGALAAMRSMYKAEPVQFRIPEGSIGSFLAARGLTLLEQVTPRQMQERYLAATGRVLACLAFARCSTALGHLPAP
jgi:O-methyltransferase involved in polyketide biosynthesis